MLKGVFHRTGKRIRSPQLALEKFFLMTTDRLRTNSYFMGRPGFEPGTSRLKAECSTAELATLAVF